MDGIGRALGAGAPITLDGKKLTARAINLACYGEIEQHLLAMRPNPFLIAKQQFELFQDDPAAKSELLRLATEEANRRPNYVTKREVADWISTTIDGLCFMTYLSVRDNDRAVYTLEHVTSLLYGEHQKLGDAKFAARRAEIEQAVNAAGGTDELGKSTGEAKEPVPAAGKTSDSPGGE